MRGFDRPLKPEWIYQMIQLLEVGDNLQEKKQSLDDVLVELDGETGKRKVRTVIGRYFLKDLDNKGQQVKNSLIFRLVKNKTIEEAKPLMLFTLLVKSPLLQHFSKQLYNYYGNGGDIDSDFMREKAYEKIGERDIARRSLRNFLNTLVDFGVLIQSGTSTYRWGKKLQVSEENMVNFLKILACEYFHSPQISLYDLPEHLLFYFEIPDCMDIANKYNNVYWQYVRHTNRASITIV